VSISQFATYVNPLITTLKKLGGSARPREVVDAIAVEMQLPDTILDERLANGVPRYENQVHWARSYLAEMGYIDRSKRGVWSLTEKGSNAPTFSEDDLRQLIRDVQQRVREAAPSVSETAVVPSAEAEDAAPDAIEANYREKVLSILKALPPAGFERLCQRLLRESSFEQVTVTGRSNDGGIDGHGLVLVNPFVSFRVLFQCKRYEGAVSPTHVRDFRGAMTGRAEKGIILTTGTFTAEAKREATRDGAPPIELVDGDRLVSLFEELELGLKPRKTFDVDDAFFAEFR